MVGNILYSLKHANQTFNIFQDNGKKSAICAIFSLRSRRYLGGGMRRREKESEEKWEGRERNSSQATLY
jgi:hypothetical protein